MLGLIFSAYDANDIDNEKSPPRPAGPVNLKFLFGFDMLGREKDRSTEEDSSQIQPERVIYVFLSQ